MRLRSIVPHRRWMCNRLAVMRNANFLAACRCSIMLRQVCTCVCMFFFHNYRATQHFSLVNPPHSTKRKGYERCLRTLFSLYEHTHTYNVPHHLGSAKVLALVVCAIHREKRSTALREKSTLHQRAYVPRARSNHGDAHDKRCTRFSFFTKHTNTHTQSWMCTEWRDENGNKQKLSSIEWIVCGAHRCLQSWTPKAIGFDGAGAGKGRGGAFSAKFSPAPFPGLCFESDAMCMLTFLRNYGTTDGFRGNEGGAWPREMRSKERG